MTAVTTLPRDTPHNYTATLAIVRTFAELSATNFDLHDLLQNALDILAEQYDFDLLAITLVNDETDELQLQAFKSEYPVAALHNLVDSILKAVESGSTVNTLTPFTVNDETTTRACLVIPLMIGRLVIGTMALTAAHLSMFSPQNEELLCTFSSQVTVAISNAKLYEKSREQQQQAIIERQISEHLHELTSLLSKTLNLHDVFDVVLRHISVVIPYSQAAILMVDGHSLVPRAANGFPGELKTYQIDLSRETFFQHVLEHKYPAKFHTLAQKLANYADLPLTTQTNAWIAAPLVIKGRIIGLLSLHHTEPGYFDRADLDLVHIYANQASIGIENAQLYRREQAKVKQFKTVAKLGQQARQFDALTPLLNMVVQSLHHELGYEFITLFLATADQTALKLAAANDFSQSVIEENPDIIPLQHPGVIANAANNGTPILVNDVEAYPDYFPGPGREVVKSEMALPLLSQQHLIGVLDIQCSNPHAFSPDDLIVAQTIADQVAAAIRIIRYVAPAVAENGTPTDKLETLQQQYQAQSNFLQNAAHDLRTPLTFVKSYVDLILNGELGNIPPEAAERLGIVARRTADIIRQVNNLNAQYQTAASPHLVTVDLADLLTTIVQNAQPLVKKQQKTLRLALVNNTPCVIQADPDRIIQVLDNLIDNALKFTAPSDIITISLESTANEIEMTVTDTGQGIAVIDQPYIFNRYYQAQIQRDRKKGAGLGLFIVKEIIEAHHGTVEVNSNPGQATTFKVVLPRHQPST